MRSGRSSTAVSTSMKWPVRARSSPTRRSSVPCRAGLEPGRSVADTSSRSPPRTAARASRRIARSRPIARRRRGRRRPGRAPYDVSPRSRPARWACAERARLARSERRVQLGVVDLRELLASGDVVALLHEDARYLAGLLERHAQVARRFDVAGRRNTREHDSPLGGHDRLSGRRVVTHLIRWLA